MKKILVLLTFVILVVIVGYLYFSGKVSTFSPYPMKYILETTSVNGTDTNPELITTVNSDTINFELKFVDGGGNNDKATLKSYKFDGKSVLSIQLHDADFVRQKMLIGYTLKGSISKLSADHYVLEIVNSDKKVLDSKELDVK
jgi:uncharacterized protein YxeA